MEILNINSFKDFNKDLTKLFDTDVSCDWLNENLNIIKKVFNIRGKKYNNNKYYTIYQLLIKLMKNMFDEKLFDSKRIQMKKIDYYYQIINISCLENHNEIINISSINL